MVILTSKYLPAYRRLTARVNPAIFIIRLKNFRLLISGSSLHKSSLFPLQIQGLKFKVLVG